MSEVDYLVDEYWRLQNGEVAIVTQRDGSICVGHIKGTDQIFIWRNGKTRVSSYDLKEQVEKP